MIETPAFRFDEAEHRYWLGPHQLPSVTQVLDSHGLIPEASKIVAAALRGSYAHVAAKYYFQGRLDWSTVALTIMPYIVSLSRWVEATHFEPHGIEVAGFHPFLLYAGTYDVEGLIPNKGLFLFDLKTGQQCAKWHHLQTAGYEGIRGGHRKRGCLHLQRDGTIAKFYPHRDTNDRANWQSCLNVFRLKEAA